MLLHSQLYLMPFLQANRADMVTLDAGEVYTAVKQFGLTAIAKEIYRDGWLTTLTIWILLVQN